ncbi:hypothetical protein MA16_Dca015356 [Dendrobium catenatum]|uniref:Uncharacterized protein n=1 Tax=Dendrobium catenatum TaxID=906689 RepID=A0A2I0W1E4_9ASPA|nr:hypothetical protein MA16_Dca015356 [Dendrobium catenatum]
MKVSSSTNLKLLLLKERDLTIVITFNFGVPVRFHYQSTSSTLCIPNIHSKRWKTKHPIC